MFGSIQRSVFEVKSRKLPGYIVSEKGIEVDPGKLKAIIDMLTPRNINQLQSLQGWLQSIKIFIAHLANKSFPFTHLLHKNVPFKWEENFEAPFN
jgi:hypothetical protein